MTPELFETITRVISPWPRLQDWQRLPTEKSRNNWRDVLQRFLEHTEPYIVILPKPKTQRDQLLVRLIQKLIEEPDTDVSVVMDEIRKATAIMGHSDIRKTMGSENP